MPVRMATWGVVLLVAMALTPQTASAIDVTITYEISGGTASGFLTGAVSPGGTVSVTAFSAYGLYSAPYAPWHLNSLNFQTTGGGVFSVFSHANVGSDYGTITANRDQFSKAFVNVGQIVARSGSGTFHTLTGFHIQASGGPPRTTGTISIRGVAEKYPPFEQKMVKHQLAIGQEISRVPEPGTFAQLAVGVTGLAAFAAGARRRRRRNSPPETLGSTSP